MAVFQQGASHVQHSKKISPTTPHAISLYAEQMIRRRLDYKLSYSFLNNSNWDTDITQSLGLPDELEEHPDKQHIARKLLTAWHQQIQHLHSDNLDYTQAYCNIDFVARRLGLSEAEQAMLRFALHMNRENALRDTARLFHAHFTTVCRFIADIRGVSRHRFAPFANSQRWLNTLAQECSLKQQNGGWHSISFC